MHYCECIKFFYFIRVSSRIIIFIVRQKFKNLIFDFRQNTIRLWLPQLFASLHEYEQFSSEATSMCSILEYSVNKTASVQNIEKDCVVVRNDIQLFLEKYIDV